MRLRQLFSMLAIVGASIGIAASSAQAAAIPLGSTVQAYFGSNSSPAIFPYQQQDPGASSFWTPPGFGPYPVGAPIPNVPNILPTPFWDGSGTFPSNQFAFPGGYTSTFTDAPPIVGSTTAISNISDNFTPAPVLVEDLFVNFTGWNLTQTAGALGYAYNQLNFVADYGIITSVPLGGSTPTLPISVTGSTVAGYAQFDAVINYSWIPTNPISNYFPTGPAVPLGTLTYSFIQSGGGAFSMILNATGSLAATPVGYGVLEIQGTAWVAGDPFDITINSVPEPATLGMLGAGLSMLAAMAIRRRRA
ncbi:MAG: PEP-CTERM sorting domain-containing protein [Planctomycetota bacterium]|nr:PEP-CTERM sorting domain-containing protein [Planctomycetota bacterium]